jgi:hypothetical protein
MELEKTILKNMVEIKRACHTYILNIEGPELFNLLDDSNFKENDLKEFKSLIDERFKTLEKLSKKWDYKQKGCYGAMPLNLFRLKTELKTANDKNDTRLIQLIKDLKKSYDSYISDWVEFHILNFEDQTVIFKGGA